MRLLLDTHAFLWWIARDPRLSQNARDLISDIENETFLSAASGWEIAIKAGLGRLTVPEPLEEFMAEQVSANAFTVLPVHLSHALRVASLPYYHRDPFDRILLAQAQVEELVLITDDAHIVGYRAEVRIAW